MPERWLRSSDGSFFSSLLRGRPSTWVVGRTVTNLQMFLEVLKSRADFPRILSIVGRRGGRFLLPLDSLVAVRRVALLRELIPGFMGDLGIVAVLLSVCRT